ncbi:hypothetical protein DOTSEDRAFT_27980 [Dothistroma septosporum NZE10]|uniref:Ecp2 effector protein domain-containing protein n=1 Tax=Dothistroma septosporum (strain NZE10 / CBS 128990) TaxID=675120 RepID=N1PEN3_DOTSN|nr:hypothetical protein DOTSEDRAFT_27980 [Dothistroma septosporum NZE10]
MKLTTFAAGAALAVTGAVAQATPSAGGINCKITPVGGDKDHYTVYIGEPDSTCGAVALSLSQLKHVHEYTCAAHLTNVSTQVYAADSSEHEAVVEALQRAYPGLEFYQKGACRKNTTKREETGVNAGRATRGITKRAAPGQAVYNVCDITSVAGQNNGKTTLLLNVDIGLPFNGGSGCNYIHDRIGSIGDWSCTDDGSGDTSLKFTTERNGKLVPVRDATVNDIFHAYGGAITSQNVGGIHDHGYCTATYPSKRRATRNVAAAGRIQSQLTKRVESN